jgi:cytidylate kinase
MYRACGLKALRSGVDPKDEVAVGEMLKTLDVKVEYRDGVQHTILDGEDVSTAIRENPVSMAASHISAHPAVREKLVEMQREIAKQMSCVLDGRDIGSVVLPFAKFKFFVTARSEVRAKRRYDELVARGQTVDFDALHAEIIQRDKQDSERKFAPLKKADDAIELDTSEMTIEEVLAFIKGKIQERI